MKLFFFFILFVSTPVFAQTPQGIDGLQALYKSASDWNSDFTQSTYVDVLGKKIEKKGKISVKKPGKLRIEYTSDPQKLYISDSKKLWIYLPADKQVESFKKIDRMISKEALTFLEGLGDVQKEFNVIPINEDDMFADSVLNKKLSLFLLTPQDAVSTIDRIVLGVDKQTHMVMESTIYNSSGNVTHYIFSNTQMNLGLGDELFKFDIPQGVKEIKGN